MVKYGRIPVGLINALLWITKGDKFTTWPCYRYFHLWYPDLDVIVSVLRKCDNSDTVYCLLKYYWNDFVLLNWESYEFKGLVMSVYLFRWIL